MTPLPLFDLSLHDFDWRSPDALDRVRACTSTRILACVADRAERGARREPGRRTHAARVVLAADQRRASLKEKR